MKSVIPESVSTTWHDWRKSLKKAEHEITGSEDFSEGVEMAGWGVEEAEKKNKAEASKSQHTEHFYQSRKALKVEYDTLHHIAVNTANTLAPQVWQPN